MIHLPALRVYRLQHHLLCHGGLIRGKLDNEWVLTTVVGLCFLGTSFPQV